jgi:hypothetical protein
MHRLGWEPWAFDALTGALFGAATFVVAFVLSGTLTDYNASEDMAVQLVNAAEAIQDTNLISVAAYSDYDPSPLTKELIQVLQTTDEWLRQGKSLDTVKMAVDQLNSQLIGLQHSMGFSAVSHGQTEIAKIRILLNRMHLSRSTDFLAPAYVLLELFLAGSFVALLLIRADSFSENLVVSCFLFTSFTYLLLLIRDLDNPFQYDGSSCVDVDLSPLEEMRDRLQQSLSQSSLSSLKS